MTLESRRGRIIPPDLDDRTWQDLVDEMRALIPKYAPQWTDHNPSDLGITLIELFAWLGEGIIFRLNQTPEKNYLAFLNLLGITRDPPSPARTHLTFTSGAAVPVVVPAGTQAQTVAPPGGQPVTFETDEDLVVLPAALTAALAFGPFSAGDDPGAYSNNSATLIGPPTGSYLLDVPPGETVQLCLGFDQASTAELSIDLRLYQAAPALGPAAVSCTYSKGTLEPLDWPLVTALGDGTEGLRHDGTLRLSIPADWAAQRAAGQGPPAPWTSVLPATGADAVAEPLFWMGLSVSAPDDAAPALTVGIDRLLFNAASARTALTVRSAEVVGVSTGQAFQVFPLRYRPLFRRPGLATPYADLVVQVESVTPETWEEWVLVDEFPPGAGDVYRVDPVAGEIRFGNFDDRSGTGSGSVPPAGRRIQAARYRYVDSGAGGNVGPSQVSVLGTTPSVAMPDGVRAVSNLGPARGGADEEPIEETMRRAPEELRIRYRAVTVDDYEFLAREASNDLVIRRCLPPRVHTADAPGQPPPWLAGDPWEFGGLVRAPGTANLIVVPDRGLEVPRPEPAPDQIRLVQSYLDSRRDLTARLEVVAPRYLPVIVNVEIIVWQFALDAGADRATIEADTRQRIRAFLHPTRGGPEGKGWNVGDPVFTSDLFQALMPTEDIGYISVLQVRPDTPAYHFPPVGPGGVYKPDLERPFALSPFGASVRLADYELVCAAADAVQLVKTTPVQA
ncbi:baseplate J/gp47 family protein [Kribbella sp. NBC_01510]|uniref:baseplate J/gp47 family protein n=1 Tax=Kribbella sp. NBC_01510 TaxID=2903581 RepID=UPI0038706732